MLAGSGAAVDVSSGVVSAVRSVGGQLEVRAFNPSADPVEFTFGSARTDLGPWQIQKLRVPHPELGK